MRGGKNKQPLGYTIVEVMIVLAVSGVMFVIAANFINGKQQKTAFTQSVNETASRVQGMIEQVTDGQYSDIPFDCSASGSPLQISANINPNNKVQGTNPGCVFIGKLLMFYPNSGGDLSNYDVFSLAAARSSTSLGADVTPVYSRSDGGASVDLTTQQSIPQHLKLSSTKVTIVTPAGATDAGNYSFGFAQSQGTTAAEAGTYESGAQTINLIYSPSLNSPTTVNSKSNAVSALSGHVAPAKSAIFCLTDGTYYAQISIGNSTTNDTQLGVRVKTNGETPC